MSHLGAYSARQDTAAWVMSDEELVSLADGRISLSISDVAPRPESASNVAISLTFIDAIVARAGRSRASIMFPAYFALYRLS